MAQLGRGVGAEFSGCVAAGGGGAKKSCAVLLTNTPGNCTKSLQVRCAPARRDPRRVCLFRHRPYDETRAVTPAQRRLVAKVWTPKTAHGGTTRLEVHEKHPAIE